MPLKPFAGLERRLAFLRTALLAAPFLGIVASWPAWSNTRSFPLVPIVPWFPILSSPADKVLVAVMLGSLISALWFYRLGVITFLITTFLAFCEDQNRGQPWLYMYWVMLALSLARGAVGLAACRIAISVVYFWSGIQKLNSRFFEIVPAWFVTPAVNWHWPSPVVHLLKAAVASAPFVEVAIAVLLWVPRTRSAAIVMVLTLHSVSLIFLGPLGYNYNWVVWPWNVAMMALVWGLFSSAKLLRTPVAGDSGKRKSGSGQPSKAKQTVAPTVIPTLADTLRELRSCKNAFVTVLLYAFLPILSFFGWWDSYFSFSLYAENAARANIFITQSFADRLPADLRKYVQPFATNFDPQHQGPLMLAFDPWCYEQLHIPPIPEIRNFKGIFNHLKKYAKSREELRMIIGPRTGPVIFLQGDEVELLGRK